MSATTERIVFHVIVMLIISSFLYAKKVYEAASLIKTQKCYEKQERRKKKWDKKAGIDAVYTESEQTEAEIFASAKAVFKRMIVSVVLPFPFAFIILLFIYCICQIDVISIPEIINVVKTNDFFPTVVKVYVFTYFGLATFGYLAVRHM